MSLHSIFLSIDSFFIWFYRIHENPTIGYFIGTTVLAFLCMAIGRATLFALSGFNKRQIRRDMNAMTKMHDLSLKALAAKDKDAYRACNKEANEAFGKYFFSQIAVGISCLWPIPFALGWMQIRFLDVEFFLPFDLPLIGRSVGYTFTFIPIYILIHILFGKIKLDEIVKRPPVAK